MKIDQYYQRQCCKHVDRRIGAILACFRVARVCQRQLGFLVLLADRTNGRAIGTVLRLSLCL